MNLKLAAILIALSLPLAGCGNKGPLVLPPKPPAESMLDVPADPVDDADDDASEAPELDDAVAPPPVPGAAKPSTDAPATAPAKPLPTTPASDD